MDNLHDLIKDLANKMFDINKDDSFTLLERMEKHVRGIVKENAELQAKVTDLNALVNLQHISIDRHITRNAELLAKLTESEQENKKLRKIIALSNDDSERKWVKPKPKFWSRTNG
jgi:uncharacterized membrane-anchored protein YhcB (DUF1043 family)